MVKKSTKRPTPKQKQSWKIGSAIIIAFFAVVASFLIWFFYVGSTKEIVAVADQFKPDPTWQLKSEVIEPPRSFCLDVECPSVWKEWNTDQPITYQDLKVLIESSGWSFKIDGDCQIDKDSYGDSLKLCSVMGIIDSYNVMLTVQASNPEERASISLNVWKDS